MSECHCPLVTVTQIIVKLKKDNQYLKAVNVSLLNTIMLINTVLLWLLSWGFIQTADTVIVSRQTRDPGRCVANSSLHTGLLSCVACDHVLQRDNEAMCPSLNTFDTFYYLPVFHCLTPYTDAWISDVLSTFNLLAKFRFVLLTGSPVLVSRYRLSTTNITSCRAELTKAWLPGCWAGQTPRVLLPMICNPIQQ